MFEAVRSDDDRWVVRDMRTGWAWAECGCQEHALFWERLGNQEMRQIPAHLPPFRPADAATDEQK